MDKKHIEFLTPELLSSEDPIWVNPVGGLGDILMLSTALKRSFDKYSKKIHLARRSQYTEFFSQHPAIQEIGHPPIGSYIVCNDYWMREDFNNVNNKALDITCKIFGIETCSNDELYLPEIRKNNATDLLIENIPWRNKNVAIVFSSESPRKMMHPVKWHIIVEKLLAQDCFVVQIGRIGDIAIRGAYSLLGATSPLQIIDILKKVDAVITLDNYVMHAAKLVHTPTIALFGPTEASRYGYNEHICLQANLSQCNQADKCLGPHVANNYSTPCPLREKHCMNTLDEYKIVDITMSLLNSNSNGK